MAVSKNAAGYSGLTEDEEKQLKALLNKAQQAPKASGGSAMTDASKRLRGESDSDFEAVGSPTTPSELFRSEDRKEVPLPKNCTLKEWSHTVCQLPKGCLGVPQLFVCRGGAGVACACVCAGLVLGLLIG